MDIPLTEAKIAIKPCADMVPHKVIILSLAIRHIGYPISPIYGIMFDFYPGSGIARI